MIGARPGTACERLTERVLGVAAEVQSDDSLAEIVGRRVFDTLGALAVSSSVGIRYPAFTPGSVDPVMEVRRLCAAVRCTEVDDIDRRACVTPGSVAVPVALSLAAGRDVSAAKLLAAIAAGYEAMVAVGQAIDGPRVLYRGIWPSYVAAPVAAAATAAWLLELDERTTNEALAIAAARLSGLVGRPSREPTSRWFLYGCAAADGVAAALAADCGMFGDSALLDAALRQQIDDQTEPIAVRADTPAVARVDAKPFCVARQALAAVEAARHVWTQLSDCGIEAIAAIEVGVPEAYLRMVDQPDPRDRITSIMSVQFQIAAALVRRELLYDVGRAEREPGLAMRALMNVIQVAPDPELTPLYPEIWGADVRVRLRDGRQARVRVLEPEGSGERTSGWDWLERKHVALGSFGATLDEVSEICRSLHSSAHVPARHLLELALSQEGELTREAR